MSWVKHTCEALGLIMEEQSQKVAAAYVVHYLSPNS